MDCASYHKLVKTTPKPRATKKSNGELVGPPLSEVEPEEVAAALEVTDEGSDEVVEAMAL